MMRGPLNRGRLKIPLDVCPMSPQALHPVPSVPSAVAPRRFEAALRLLSKFEFMFEGGADKRN